MHGVQTCMPSTREVFESQGLLASLKSGRAETGRGGWVRDVSGMWATPTLRAEPGRAFLSLNQRADSLPEAAVCVGRGAGVLGGGVVPRSVPCWMACDAKVHFVLLGKSPCVYWICMAFLSPACSALGARTFWGTQAEVPRGLRTGCGTCGRLGW